MTTKLKLKKEAPVSAAVAYAKAHKLNPRHVRAALRRAGLKAPYTEAQIKKVMTTE